MSVAILLQLFAHRHGRIRSVGGQNIHAIVDGGIRRPANLDDCGGVSGEILLSAWQQKLKHNN